MFKVLAAVLAVLSAVISITLYSTTIPAVQKQAADNAEAIEQLQSAVENIPERKNLYLHTITIQATNDEADIYEINLILNIINDNTNVIDLINYFENGERYPASGNTIDINENNGIITEVAGITNNFLIQAYYSDDSFSLLLSNYYVEQHETIYKIL